MKKMRSVKVAALASALLPFICLRKKTASPNNTTKQKGVIRGYSLRAYPFRKAVQDLYRSRRRSRQERRDPIRQI